MLPLAEDAFAITPHDNKTLRNPARFIYVGGEGNLKFKTYKGNTVTLANLPAGSWVPCGALQVFATDTTATDLVGFA